MMIGNQSHSVPGMQQEQVQVIIMPSIGMQGRFSANHLWTGNQLHQLQCDVQGKATLSNHLLSRERSLTGPEPGLTRDTVRDSFEYEGRKVELADTAGWLRLAEAKKEDDHTR